MTSSHSQQLYRQVARMFMVGFPGTSPDPDFKALVNDGLFGAILFKRNVTSAAQTAELCREVKSLANRPFILSVDQEGGRVARLRGEPFTALPPMRELGRRDSPAFEQLRDYLRVPSDIPAYVVAEITDMHRARCFADSQSYRQMRGPILWSELHWLREQTLIEAFRLMWTPKHYQWWRTSPLVRHPNAGPALWMQVLAKTADSMT